MSDTDKTQESKTERMNFDSTLDSMTKHIEEFEHEMEGCLADAYQAEDIQELKNVVIRLLEALAK